MRKFVLTILLTAVGICIVLFSLSEKTALASEGYDNFRAVIESTKYQFGLAYGREMKNTDELVSYADHLAKNNAIAIWDDLYDGDGFIGNSFSKNRYFADSNYILFQTKEDAENKNDTLIVYDLSGDTLEVIDDRSINFALLDQMDKEKNDEILQDGYGHSISKEDFINTPNVTIVLGSDKFQIIGLVYVLKETPAPVKTIPKSTTNPSKIAVNKVTLNKTSITIKKGQKYLLKATISPSNASEKRVKWSSNKSAIASVDAYGNITAKLTGIAKISVTTVDGKKTCVCVVKVSGTLVEAPKPTKPAKDPNNFSYKVGDTPTLYSAAGYGPLEWVPSNTSIVRVVSTNGQYCTIECLKEGDVTIIVYVNTSKLIYDPKEKIFIKMPIKDDYYHYKIHISK